MVIFFKTAQYPQIHGWTAHMLLYQSQMRNLVQKKNIRGGAPAPVLGGACYQGRRIFAIIQAYSLDDFSVTSLILVFCF